MTELTITIKQGCCHIQKKIQYMLIEVEHGDKSYILGFPASFIDSPVKILAEFRDFGLSLECRKSEFIKVFESARNGVKAIDILISSLPGFYGGQYVTPTNTFKKTNKSTRVRSEQSLSLKKRATYSKSTYKKFKKTVESIVVKSKVATLFTASTYAGILLGALTKTEGLIVYRAAKSSTGKTTLMKMAKEFWPKEVVSHLSRTDFTMAGLEDTLSESNNQTIFLDEFNRFLAGNNAGNIVHIIAEGEGRQKSKSDSIQNKFPDKKWKAVVCAAGETSFRERLGADQRKGAAARVIECSHEEQVNLTDEFHELENVFGTHDGWAFSKFVNYLVNNRSDVQKGYEELAQSFVNKVGADDDFLRRKAKSYALLAYSGELMIKLKLLELKKEFFVKTLSDLYEDELQEIDSNDKIQTGLLPLVNYILAMRVAPDMLVSKKKLKEIDFQNASVKGFHKLTGDLERIFIKKDIFENILSTCLSEKYLHDLAKKTFLESPKKRRGSFQQCAYTDANGFQKQKSFAVFDLVNLERFFKKHSQ